MLGSIVIEKYLSFSINVDKIPLSAGKIPKHLQVLNNVDVFEGLLEYVECKTKSGCDKSSDEIDQIIEGLTKLSDGDSENCAQLSFLIEPLHFLKSTPENHRPQVL